MEENTRQRANDISEINMEIDETTAVSVTAGGLVHISVNLSEDMTVSAISDPVTGENHHLTDNILLPKIADFCNTGEKILLVNLETTNLTNTFDENNTEVNSTAMCAILNGSEQSQSVPGTILSGVDLVLKQEMIDSVPVISSKNEHSVMESISNPLEEISKSEQNFVNSSAIVEEKPNVLGFTSEDEENFVVSEDTKLTLSANIEDVEFESHQHSYEAITVFNNPIRQVASAWSDFQNGDREGFTKGCKWSPDGLCLLTNSEDNALRIFELPRDLQRSSLPSQMDNLPEMKSVLRMPEGGTIYDYCWYPLMSSFDPATCCLASTAQNNPVHLWDAYDGSLRASYRAYNQVDEVEAATSVAFSPSGDKIYCGFKHVVRVFDTAVPGRDCDTRVLKDKKIADSQRGIVSCITVNPADPKVYAVGTYLKSIGIYSEGQRQAVAYLLGHAGGLTQLAFSPDGARLFSGGRRDGDIICWDLRNSAQVLYTMRRQVTTNQRIQFDVTSDGDFLVSGGTDGVVSVWDLNAVAVAPSNRLGDPMLPAKVALRAHADCANGVSIHHRFPVLATSSGQRHFQMADGSSSESLHSADEGTTTTREDCVKLWWTGTYE